MPHKKGRNLAPGASLNFQVDLPQVQLHRDEAPDPARQSHDLFFRKGPNGDQSKKTRLDPLRPGFIHRGEAASR